ncbi:MAG: hypothetical protein SNJ72_01780 [Fimbriimonadales bacterium]
MRSAHEPIDQASGLREAVSLSRRVPVSIPLPTVHAHLLGCRNARLPVPASGLIWHWHAGARPAVGWDLQARLHVVGAPHQFHPMELNHWRSLLTDWHLLQGGLEMVGYADYVWLWLATGANRLQDLRKLLEWHCRNYPQKPIIFAGLGPAPLERLTLWAQSRYPLRCWSAEHPRPEGLPTPQAYYRLLEASRPSSHERRLRQGRLYEQ